MNRAIDKLELRQQVHELFAKQFKEELQQLGEGASNEPAVKSGRFVE